jgi:hypothetical protein
LRKSQQKSVIGAIFPILRKHVPALFSSCKGAFAKFTSFTLEPDSILVFYVSREKLLIGQARIRRVEKLEPRLAWTRYNKKLFLDKEEYDDYAIICPVGKDRRRMSRITVFELVKAKKYQKPISSMYTVTPSGRYLTKTMLNRIKDSVQR